jgi:subtilisin family serine protease
VLNLVADYEKRYDFKRAGLTSWVGTSITAFLTPAQIRLLREDRRVRLLSDNASGSFSVDPPLPNIPPTWVGTTSGNETYSYGRNAVNGKTLLAGSTRKVYIIDNGVALHTDLGSVGARVNVACGNGGDCTNVLLGSTTYAPTGCYAHATHVAGIIGATANNGQGVAGVYAGVTMISVATTSSMFPFVNGLGSPTGSAGSGWCNNMSANFGAVGYALDYIYQQTRNGSQQVPIVNISMNSFAMGYTGSGVAEANNPKLLFLATPTQKMVGPKLVKYPGAFVVQSAGNGDNAPGNTTVNFNACSAATNGASLAYRPNPALFPYSADPNDGIMLVGAVHASGQPVTPSMPFFGPPYNVPHYPLTPALSGLPAPSNYGPCVDIWAPGVFIPSTFGDHAAVGTAQTVSYLPYPNFYYSGNVFAGSSGWAFLSGTSMAAPHVAGAAAYLADYFNLTTPAAIEAKVRQYSQSFFNDQGGSAAKVVQLPS